MGEASSSSSWQLAAVKEGEKEEEKLWWVRV